MADKELSIDDYVGKSAKEIMMAIAEVSGPAYNYSGYYDSFYKPSTKQRAYANKAFHLAKKLETLGEIDAAKNAYLASARFNSYNDFMKKDYMTDEEICRENNSSFFKDALHEIQKYHNVSFKEGVVLTPEQVEVRSQVLKNIQKNREAMNGGGIHKSWVEEAEESKTYWGNLIKLPWGGKVSGLDNYFREQNSTELRRTIRKHDHSLSHDASEKVWGLYADKRYDELLGYFPNAMGPFQYLPDSESKKWKKERMLRKEKNDISHFFELVNELHHVGHLENALNVADKVLAWDGVKKSLARDGKHDIYSHQEWVEEEYYDADASPQDGESRYPNRTVSRAVYKQYNAPKEFKQLKSLAEKLRKKLKGGKEDGK